jgi:putative protein kinase ArgK-like GTPase of G3E family
MKSSDFLSAADKLALSRLISEVENETSAGKTALDDCFSRSGKAHLIGVTGAPGTGKSSLVNRLAQLIRREGKQTVATFPETPACSSVRWPRAENWAAWHARLPEWCN